MYSTSVVLCHFISLLYGSLPLIPSFISAFGNALSPDIAIIFLNTHFWSCREFFDKMYVCEWGRSDEECWVFFFFFLVWEGFQYNLVKHNELTKGAFRVSEIYTFTLQKFSLSLFPMCAQ